MNSFNSKKQDEDWVDRWSRNLAVAVQRGWPPTRDWLKQRREDFVPTRHHLISTPLESLVRQSETPFNRDILRGVTATRTHSTLVQ
jgi:hypothetical protein